MKWYCIIVVCSLQSFLCAMETEIKRKKVVVTTLGDEAAVASQKPSPPIRKKSKEIVIPSSSNYTLSTSLENAAAATMSAKQIAAFAPHFEDRKGSPPQNASRKGYRNSREIRQAILAHKAQLLSKIILEAQELQISELEEQFRKQLSDAQDEESKQELAGKLAALNRTAIAESIKVRLYAMQEERKGAELAEKEAKRLMEQAFALRMAEIKSNSLRL